MTEEEKNKLVDEVIEDFDFDKARSIMYLTKKDIHVVPSIVELKADARKYLCMALEHQDREFWWAGGMHRVGICACYDDKWGLSLNYIAVANKVRIPKESGT